MNTAQCSGEADISSALVLVKLWNLQTQFLKSASTSGLKIYLVYISWAGQGNMEMDKGTFYKTALKNINQKMILLTCKFTISATCDKIYYSGRAEEQQILIDDSFWKHFVIDLSLQKVNAIISNF